MNFIDWLRDQRWARWAIPGLGAAIVVAIAWGGWATWKSRYEAQGGMALVQARLLAAQAQAPGAPPDTRERAARALEAVIRDYPRLSTVDQAAYLLGGIRFSAAQYPEARASYQLTRTKARSKSLAALASLDIGYCWEAEKNYAAAENAYQSAINETKPKDFLYEEGMIDIARSQELAGKPSAALETYQRLIKNVPDTRRAEEIRFRMRNLQAAVKP